MLTLPKPPPPAPSCLSRQGKRMESITSFKALGGSYRPASCQFGCLASFINSSSDSNVSEHAECQALLARTVGTSALIWREGVFWDARFQTLSLKEAWCVGGVRFAEESLSKRGEPWYGSACGLAMTLRLDSGEQVYWSPGQHALLGGKYTTFSFSLISRAPTTRFCNCHASVNRCKVYVSGRCRIRTHVPKEGDAFPEQRLQ